MCKWSVASSTRNSAQAAQAMGREGGGVVKIWGNVWEFVMIMINHRICHEIHNKCIVPENGGPLYPQCWSKAATATIGIRNSRKHHR